jgi:hypothetical protein
MNDMTQTAAEAETKVSALDLTDAVRSTALLADLTISVWSAERTDHAIMEQVKRDANAVGNVGRAVKNLLAGVDTQLKETRSAFMACRTLHYSLTLPWVANPHATRMTGPRLLPTALFMRYVEEMGKQKRAAMQQLDAFVLEYPNLQQQAMQNLGGLAQASDYPTPGQIKAQFDVRFDFEPVPAAQSFGGLPPATLEKLGNALQRKQENMTRNAQAAMWTEARERIQHLAEKLADPEAKFKNTTVVGVQDLLTLLPGWNVAGDERIAEIVSDVKEMLAGIDVKDLRKDEIVRKQVAGEAQKVVDKLAQWGI